MDIWAFLTQEHTRECCTYPLAIYPSKSAQMFVLLFFALSLWVSLPRILGWVSSSTPKYFLLYGSYLRQRVQAQKPTELGGDQQDRRYRAEVQGWCSSDQWQSCTLPTLIITEVKFCFGIYWFQVYIRQKLRLIEVSDLKHSIDLLMGLFRGAVFHHGGGARKQPIKQLTEMPTSTMH